MEVLIPDEIRNDPALASSVNAVSEYLSKDFTSTVLNPTARWRLSQDVLGGPVLELEIADGPDAVSHRFTTVDFADRWRVEGRLSRLWDQLLGKRSERQQKLITELLREMEASEA